MAMRMQERLDREVAVLGDLPRAELVERWVKAFGSPPPKGIKQALLVRAAAWHLQKRRLGGLSSESSRVLKATMRRLEAGRLSPTDAGCVGEADGVAVFRNASSASQLSPSSSGASSNTPPAVSPVRIVLKPGARLVREWNGRMNVVEVTDNGFIHEGKTYRSLSAIAKRITGAHWSGPRFFGL